jgi:predicted nucleic acid-binding protein
VFPVETTQCAHAGRAAGADQPTQGALLFIDLMNSLPLLHPSLPLLPRAYEISSALRVGVYDWLYVALAEREQIELITADDRLVRNLKPHFPFIVALSSLP